MILNHEVNVFPFTLYSGSDIGEAIFKPWFKANRRELSEKYGSYHYVGSSLTPERCEKWGTIYKSGGYELAFSYYECDIKVRSTTEVTFMFYDMDSSYSGGFRGALRQEVEATLPESVLAEVIFSKKFDAAEREYNKRLAMIAAEKHRVAVMRVFKEMYPNG